MPGIGGGDDCRVTAGGVLMVMDCVSGHANNMCFRVAQNYTHTHPSTTRETEYHLWAGSFRVPVRLTLRLPSRSTGCPHGEIPGEGDLSPLFLVTHETAMTPISI